jgi:hypothetical protein
MLTHWSWSIFAIGWLAGALSTLIFFVALAIRGERRNNYGRMP